MAVGFLAAASRRAVKVTETGRRELRNGPVRLRVSREGRGVGRRKRAERTGTRSSRGDAFDGVREAGSFPGPPRVNGRGVRAAGFPGALTEMRGSVPGSLLARTRSEAEGFPPVRPAWRPPPPPHPPPPPRRRRREHACPAARPAMRLPLNREMLKTFCETACESRGQARTPTMPMEIAHFDPCVNRTGCLLLPYPDGVTGNKQSRCRISQ